MIAIPPGSWLKAVQDLVATKPTTGTVSFPNQPFVQCQLGNKTDSWALAQT